MRMRFLALGLAAIVILTGCKADTPTQSKVIFYTGAWYGGSPASVDTGILYNNFEKGMQFFDFETFQSVSICARPNCTHDTSEINCTAQGLPQSVCYYNDKLYYVISSSERNSKGILINYTELYSCDRNGGSRQKLARADDVYASYLGLYMLEGDKIYFLLARPDTEVNEYTGVSEVLGDKSIDLYCYDIGENDFYMVSSFYEGYEVGASPCGYDAESGMLYYFLNYSVERTKGKNMTDSEFLEKITYKLMKMDIHTGETSEWEYTPSSNRILSIYKGFVYFSDANDAGGTMRVKKMNVETGEEAFLTDFPVFSYTIEDDMVFMREASNFTPGESLNIEKHGSLGSKMFYYDLKTGELVQISKFRSGYSLSTSILSSYKDMYIVRVVDISEPNLQKDYIAKIKKTDYLKSEMNFIATYDGAIY